MFTSLRFWYKWESNLEQLLNEVLADMTGRLAVGTQVGLSKDILSMAKFNLNQYVPFDMLKLCRRKAQ